MKFVRVINQIQWITSGAVQFDGIIWSIDRVRNKQTIWKLKKDGIYVLEEIADAHKLRRDYVASENNSLWLHGIPCDVKRLSPKKTENNSFIDSIIGL